MSFADAIKRVRLIAGCIASFAIVVLASLTGTALAVELAVVDTHPLQTQIPTQTQTIDNANMVSVVLGQPVLEVGSDGGASWSYSVPSWAELVYYEIRWLAAKGREANDWSGKQNRVFYGGDVMSYDIAGLKAGVEYKVKVFVGLSVNGERHYAKSNIVMLTPVAMTQPTDNSPPGAVGNLMAVRSGGDIVASWDAAELADGYEVVYSTDGTATWSQAMQRSVTSYTLADADIDKSYVIGVRAVNTAGKGVWMHSNMVSVVLGQPVLEVGSDGGASWSYSVPSWAELVYYEIRWLAAKGREANDWSGKQNRVFYGGDVMSYDIAGLKAGVEYKVKVFVGLSVNGERHYAKSNIVMLTPVAMTQPTDNSPPGAVGNLMAVRSGGDIVASWDAAELADGYEVVYSTDGTATWSQAMQRSVTSYTLADADIDKSYVIGVRAVNTAGKGVWMHSNMVSVVLGQPVLEVGSDGGASWSYSVPSWAELVYYEIRWLAAKGREANDWSGKQNRVFYGGDVMSYDIAGLKAGVEYKVKVFVGLSVNGERHYAKSNIVMLTPVAMTQPTDNSPPGAVGNLMAVRSGGDIVASWDAAELADGYEVVYSTDGTATWSQAMQRSVTSYTLADADIDKSYVIGVRAVNTAGKGVWMHSNMVPA